MNDGVPLRLYQRLSEKFPDVLVTVRYAGDFNGKRNGFLQFFGGIKQQSEEYSRKDRFPLLGNGLKQVSCPDDLVSVRWRSVSGCRGVPFVLGLVSGR